MRKWLPGADKRRTDVWTDVNNMVPTPLGTYHTMPTFGSSTLTGGNSGTANYVTYYCWSIKTVDGTAVTYVLGETSSGAGSTYVETLSGTALTNRSPGGASFGTGMDNTISSFAQMGNTTLFSNPDASAGGLWSRDASGSSNFALASGTYGASIMAVQSNALLLYNILDSGTRYQNSWMASDLFAPTTFTGGSSVARTAIVTTPGPITAAEPFGDAVVVFKRAGVYLHQYVGRSDFKWTVRLLRPDLGVRSKHAVINTGESLIFLGDMGVWEFDGGSFRKLSDDVSNPVFDMLGTYKNCTASMYYPADGNCVWFTSTGALFYNRRTGAFGKGTFYDTTPTALTGYVPAVGKADALKDASLMSSVGVSFYDGMYILNVSAARLRAGDSYWRGGQDAYVTGSEIGDYQKDVTVKRVIPVLRDNYYGFTSLANTGLKIGSTVSSTDRKRFDFMETVKYPPSTAAGRTFTIQNVSGSGGNGAWEIEDYIVEADVTGAT